MGSDKFDHSSIESGKTLLSTETVSARKRKTSDNVDEYRSKRPKPNSAASQLPAPQPNNPNLLHAISSSSSTTSTNTSTNDVSQNDNDNELDDLLHNIKLYVPSESSPALMTAKTVSFADLIQQFKEVYPIVSPEKHDKQYNLFVTLFNALKSKARTAEDYYLLSTALAVNPEWDKYYRISFSELAASAGHMHSMRMIAGCALSNFFYNIEVAVSWALECVRYLEKTGIPKLKLSDTYCKTELAKISDGLVRVRRRMGAAGIGEIPAKDSAEYRQLLRNTVLRVNRMESPSMNHNFILSETMFKTLEAGKPLIPIHLSHFDSPSIELNSSQKSMDTNTKPKDSNLIQSLRSLPNFFQPIADDAITKNKVWFSPFSKKRKQLEVYIKQIEYQHPDFRTDMANNRLSLTIGEYQGKSGLYLRASDSNGLETLRHVIHQCEYFDLKNKRVSHALMSSLKVVMTSNNHEITAVVSKHTASLFKKTSKDTLLHSLKFFTDSETANFALLNKYSHSIYNAKLQERAVIKLMQAIMTGNPLTVKTITSAQPDLLFQECRVTDPAGRTFKNTNGAEQILWSKEPMRDEVFACIPKNRTDLKAQIERQKQKLAKEGVTYTFEDKTGTTQTVNESKGYDLQPLITIITTKIYYGLNELKKQAWLDYGKLLREVPYWIVQLICNHNHSLLDNEFNKEHFRAPVRFDFEGADTFDDFWFGPKSRLVGDRALLFIWDLGHHFYSYSYFEVLPIFHAQNFLKLHKIIIKDTEDFMHASAVEAPSSLPFS